MLIYLKKKTLNMIMCGSILFGLSLGGIQLAGHPMLNEWQKQHIVISHVKTDQKLVSLTFDDGPHPLHTEKISTLLRDNNASGTFFMTGEKVEENPATVQKVLSDRHEIGNHSYCHKDYSQLSTQAQMEDFHQANNSIEKATGQIPSLFRPPGGYLSSAMVEHCHAEGFKIAYWTYKQDSKDWRNGVSGEYIANFILERIAPGQIIILHDGCSNSDQTAKAVGILLPELNKLGYQVVTMSELMKAENQE